MIYCAVACGHNYRARPARSVAAQSSFVMVDGLISYPRQYTGRLAMSDGVVSA